MYQNLSQTVIKYPTLLPSVTGGFQDWVIGVTTDGKTVNNNIAADATYDDVNCLSFAGDGGNNEVRCGSHVCLDSDEVEVVFTPTDETSRGVLFSMGSLAGAYGWALTWDGSADRLYARISNAGSDPSESLTTATNSCVADGTIYKAVMAYNKTAQTVSVSLYNYTTGALIETVSSSSVDSAKFPTGTSRTIVIGEDQGGSDDYYGKIHYVKSSLVELPFSEGSGSIAYDVSGNGNHGDITGATWSTSDDISSWNALNGFSITTSFDGTNDYVDTGVVFNTGTDSYSISGTFKIPVTGGNKGIFDARDGDNDGIRILFEDSGNRMFFSHNTVDVLVSGSWNDDQWHTFSMSSDGSTLTATIDNTTATGDVSSDSVSVTANATIGDNDGSDFFDGEIGTFQGSFGGVLKFDYISNIKGFYDRVSGTNKVNSAAGDLTNIRYPALKEKTKQGWQGDGSNDSIRFSHGLSPSSDFTVEVEFEITTPPSGNLAAFSLKGSSGNDYGLWLRYETSNTKWLFKIGNGSISYTSQTVSFGDIFKFVITYHASTQKVTTVMTKNGASTTLSDEQSVSNAVDFNTSQAALGALRWATSYSTFTFKSFKLLQGTTTHLEWDFATSAGRSTMEDTSGNNYDGTITNATLTDCWAARYVDSSGELVSTLYNKGITDISNPNDTLHNGNECTINMPSANTDVSAETLQTTDNSSANSIFIKRNNNGLTSEILNYVTFNPSADGILGNRSYVGA